jgi:hypothetical protein
MAARTRSGWWQIPVSDKRIQIKTGATMKTTLVITAAVAIACGALQGQNVVYQQADAIGGQIRVTGGPVGGEFGNVAVRLMGGKPVTGSPFSGTEERHSLQVLGDGTHIEQTENSQISRDAEGRTRTESTPGGNDAPAMVTIQDPVAGTTYFLDPAHKTANKLPAPKVLTGATLSASVVGPGRVSAPSGDLAKILTLQAGAAVSKSAAVSAPADEDLGVLNINGVLAKGTRTTINIPAGQIGNDRALQVVNERWYSDDLGMIVKSSNSDPRFGTATYELTNISRAAPDPSLFQVPADYMVSEGKPDFRTTQTK